MRMLKLLAILVILVGSCQEDDSTVQTGIRTTLQTISLRFWTSCIKGRAGDGGRAKERLP